MPGLLPYRPGQHISVQVPRWPRIWREYSVANAPRPGRAHPPRPARAGLSGDALTVCCLT
jgi:hypothetical protein